MLNLSEIISVREWSELRSSPQSKFKLINAGYIDQFNTLIMSKKHRYDGVIKYYTHSPEDHRYLKYGEGTPIFPLFKFTPQEVFVTQFDVKPYWEQYPIDEDVVSKFYEYDTNKYPQPDVDYDLGIDDYVLFIATTDYRIDLVFLYNAIHWASENKKHLVIKKHPYTLDEFDHNKLLRIAHKDGASLDYVRLIDGVNTDTLVDNCSMLWTSCSGVGLQAILKNKPVSYFYHDEDYMYGPIANYCRTPHEAAQASIIDTKKVYSYLSWYHNRLALDILDKNCDEVLEKRLYHYFTKKETIDEYLSIRN